MHQIVTCWCVCHHCCDVFPPLINGELYREASPSAPAGTTLLTVLVLFPSSRVFVNRSLAMEKIKCFGFDMDYTLAGEWRLCLHHLCRPPKIVFCPQISISKHVSLSFAFSRSVSLPAWPLDECSYKYQTLSLLWCHNLVSSTGNTEGNVLKVSTRVPWTRWRLDRWCLWLTWFCVLVKCTSLLSTSRWALTWRWSVWCRSDIHKSCLTLSTTRPSQPGRFTSVSPFSRWRLKQLICCYCWRACVFSSEDWCLTRCMETFSRSIPTGTSWCVSTDSTSWGGESHCSIW